ncbi:hypothetical protein JCM5353_000700 [Sporobolomyces roseus]
MSYIQSHPYATHHPAAPTPDQPSRNPSTSTSTTTTPSVSRRIIIDPVGGYEREETREERRNRKDKERQQRSNQTGIPLPESHGSPNSIPTSQLRQRPFQSIASSSSSSSRPSISSPPLPSSSSAISNSMNNPSTSSKSVLTIALQRAQSAVLLDSANNFPAAISAYSQSVRLLKEVMARVETKGGGASASASEMERKASQGSVMSLGGGRRDSESVEEWEKRKTRWEKKEKAKIDEARRLKVIHDTYEDRIKMLLTMNPSLASAASPSLAAAVLPSNSSTTTPATATTTGKNGYVDQSGESSPTTAASSPSMRFHRRRSSTELPSSPQFQQQGHRSKPSTSSLNSTGPTSPSLIGQAMLSSTPSSPQSQSHSSNIPRIAQLPLSTSHPTSLQHLSSQDPSFLNPSLRERPLSTASDSTAKGISPYSGSVTPTTSQPLPPPSSSLPLLPPPPAHQMSRTNSLPPPPNHPPPPIPSQRTDRQGSDSSLDDPIPVTALEEPSFDWPNSNHSSSINSLPIITSSSLLIQTQTTPPRPSAPARQNSIPLLSSSSTFPSTNSSPMRRGSSASAVYTQSTLPPFSNPSNSRQGSLSQGNDNGMMMRRTMSSEGGGGNVLRPMRSASLAGQGQLQAQGGFFSSGMVPSLSTGSNSSQQTQTSSQFSIGQYGRLQQREEEGLVSDSTKGGTISQRRFEGREGGRELEATIVVRAPSSESHRTGTELHYDEFGAPAAVTESRGFAGRLRALSQPGNGVKRPTLDSISPPVPPLLTQIPSNNSRHLPSLSLSSSSSQSNSKKSSVPPTPTSLFPSSNLGRSNSSSSVGSSTSGRYSDRSLPPPLPSHSHPSAPSTLTGIPSPPNRTAASSRETISSIQPVRRPFHLMRLILATMPNSPSNPSSRSSVISLVPSQAGGGGGYLSEKLFVPSQVWSIPGSKLISLDSKLRSMELLLSSLVTLNQAGQSLLSPALANTALSSGTGGERWVLEEAKRFGRELEGFEGVLEGVQNTLSKKLGGLINPTGGGIGSIISSSSSNGNGNGVGGGTGGGGGEGKEFGVMEKGGREMGSLKDGMIGGGRKGSTAGGQFASWSSKFQRGLDRVTNSNSVSLDSQATYVETIARLFKSCQCIDHHLSLLLSSSSSDSQDTTTAYTLLPLAERHRLERQLRRASEFFGTVVCRFVMKDLGMLLDKYVKRGGAWLSGE